MVEFEIWPSQQVKVNESKSTIQSQRVKVNATSQSVRRLSWFCLVGEGGEFDSGGVPVGMPAIAKGRDGERN